jgi:hypothetical protein
MREGLDSRTALSAKASSLSRAQPRAGCNCERHCKQVRWQLKVPGSMLKGWVTSTPCVTVTQGWRVAKLALDTVRGAPIPERCFCEVAWCVIFPPTTMCWTCPSTVRGLSFRDGHRFCQQCAIFHPIEEFEGSKRCGRATVA